MIVAGTVSPPYYKWRSGYEMLKLTMLLETYSIISAHNHMPTSGRLPMSLGRFIIPKHGNGKLTLMIMSTHWHHSIAKHEQLFFCCRDMVNRRRSYKSSTNQMLGHLMNGN